MDGAANAGSARLTVTWVTRAAAAPGPRNALIVPAQNKTDVRVQQKISIGGRRSFDLLADIFNVFNRPNWSIGENEATTAQYLQHISATARTMQFGFRLMF